MYHFIASPDEEAVVQMYSAKKVFLEILQNSQENTCARVSFLTRLENFHGDIFAVHNQLS